MTEEVACLVLRNNYLQTQAISIAESNAAERLREHAHLIRLLERDGELDRAIESPWDDAIEERAKRSWPCRRARGAALVQQDRLYSGWFRRPIYLANSSRVTPEPLQKRYRDIIAPSAREIIAAQITNSLEPHGPTSSVARPKGDRRRGG
jgi:glutamate dehydrogenase